jgi:hypothetical protein
MNFENRRMETEGQRSCQIFVENYKLKNQPRSGETISLLLLKIKQKIRIYAYSIIDFKN